MDLKRIYTSGGKTPERTALEEETLLRLRALRAQLKKECPGVLESIQKTYEKGQNKPALAPEPTEIPIDRKKNMQTVAAFLKLRGISVEDLKGVTRH